MNKIIRVIASIFIIGFGILSISDSQSQSIAGATCNDSCESADNNDCWITGGLDENGNSITVICHDMRKYY